MRAPGGPVRSHNHPAARPVPREERPAMKTGKGEEVGVAGDVETLASLADRRRRRIGGTQASESDVTEIARKTSDAAEGEGAWSLGVFHEVDGDQRDGSLT